MVFSIFRRIHIKAEDIVTQATTTAGMMPLQWPTGEVVGLIWRMPRDPGQRASLFAKKQSLVVNEGEIALVLQGGVSNEVLEPGAYTFDKRVTSAFDVIWMRTGRQDLKWGVGNITTTDGINIGAIGTVMVRISDGQKFNREIIQGENRLLDTDLQARILPSIQGVLRAQMAHFSALELNTQRQVFKQEVAGCLDTCLAELGLTLAEFEITEISFPAEFQAVVSRKTLNQKQGEADFEAAQYQAQVLGLTAQAEAQAHLAAGLTQLQLMAQMQSLGIDPLKFQALEVLSTFAKNPTEAMFVNGDGRGQILQQLAAGVLPVSQSPNAAPSPRPPTVQKVPLPLEGPISDPKADIERKIDQLTDRLVSGEIDQATYNLALARLQQRLTSMNQQQGAT